MIFFCVFSQAFFVVAASLMLRVRLQDYKITMLLDLKEILIGCCLFVIEAFDHPRS